MSNHEIKMYFIFICVDGLGATMVVVGNNSTKESS